MYILDTDHLSVLDRGGNTANNLLQRLATLDPNSVATTIINYEEQMRGWMSYSARAKTETQLIEAYRQLNRQLRNYCTIPVVEFDEVSVREFQRIKKLYPRIGTMDLKIASIALVNQSIVLTRNSRDFGQIIGLSTEDWT